MQSHRTGRIFRSIAQRRNQPMSEPANVRMPLGLFGCLSVYSCRPSAVQPDGRTLVSTVRKYWLYSFCRKWRCCRNGDVWQFCFFEKSSRKPRFCIQTTGWIARLYAAVESGSPAIRPKVDFYVHRNIARCVSSYSIPFELLSKALP